MKTLSEEKIRHDVEKFSHDIEKRARLTAATGLVGPAAGAIASISLGPIAFISGALIAALAVARMRSFTESKKKEIEDELLSLQNSNKVSDSEAVVLKNKLDSISSQRAVGL